MNKIYLYNTTFINLLSLIAYLIKNNVRPSNIKNSNYNPGLLDELITLNIPDNLNLFQSLKIKNPDILKVMYYVFLSDQANKELIIFYFYLNFLKYSNKVLNMRNLNCVAKTLKIAKYVSSEAHKLKGFLRFEELDNKVLYAKIEPTNNVISLLTEHFKKRLAGEYWLIHDTKRNLISVYDKKDYYLIADCNLKINLQKKDQEYEELWCTFYDTIGIKERKNNRCRLNFMPKKYWKNIIEMRNENEKSS